MTDSIPSVFELDAKLKELERGQAAVVEAVRMLASETKSAESEIADTAVSQLSYLVKQDVWIIEMVSALAEKVEALREHLLTAIGEMVEISRRLDDLEGEEP